MCLLIFALAFYPFKIWAFVSQQCDRSLWDHVYNPSRLQVMQECINVQGTVDHMRLEPDGDYHIRVHVDNDSLLNDDNVARQQADLVVEPICVGPTTQQDAIPACAGYTNNVTIPSVNDLVNITGTFVLDTSPNHGWNEIHPVTSLNIISHANVMPMIASMIPLTNNTAAIPQDLVPDDK